MGQLLPGQLFLNQLLAPQVPAGAARPFAPGEYMRNPDGSWSSERSMTVLHPNLNGGAATNIPGLWLRDGKPYLAGNEDEAAAMAKASGLSFPSYPSAKAGDQAAADRESAWQGIAPENAGQIPALWKSGPPLRDAQHSGNTPTNSQGSNQMLHPAIRSILSNPHAMAQIERALAARGRGGDDNIVHVNDQEMASLHAMGGSGTINPKTGLREFNQVGPGGAGGPGSQGGLGGANGDALGGGGGNVGGHVGGSGAEHNGQGGFIVQPGRPVILPPPPPVAPPPVMLPPPPPSNIPTTPMMSQTAGSNLIGNRFGTLPSWATQSYQIGTAPTSYPVSGQPFGNPPPPTIAPPPPVMPPPVTPGGGGNGGGGFNGGGFNGGAGGGWTVPGGPGGGILALQPNGQTAAQAHMSQLLGVPPGAAGRVPTQPASALLNVRPNGQTNAQTAAAAMLGIAPKAPPTAQAPTVGPTQQQQISAALLGQQPKMSNAGTPVKKAKAGATQFLKLAHR